MKKSFVQPSRKKFTRREFVKLAAAAGVAAGIAPVWAAESKNDMIYRTLGRTGEKVSAIGLGGYHVGLQSDEAESIRIIRTAVDRHQKQRDRS